MTTTTLTRTQTVEERLQRIEDQLAIYQLISAYGPAADSCNMDAIAQIWAEDGVYEIDGLGVFRGLEGMEEAFDGDFHRRVVGSGSAHVQSFPHVIIDGDHAAATQYSTLFVHGDGKFACERVVASRWRFERTADKGWQVKLRTNILLNGNPAARALLSGAMRSP